MLRALIGTTVLAGAFLAVGVSQAPAMTLASVKPTSSTASLALASDPSFAGTVTFTASYSPMKWIAEESVYCTQNGSQVYLDAHLAPSSAQPWSSTFTLWSQAWANNGGGPANCTTQLYYYTWQGKTETGVVYLGTVNFTTT
jgi:hypothetical protein